MKREGKEEEKKKKTRMGERKKKKKNRRERTNRLHHWLPGKAIQITKCVFLTKDGSARARGVDNCAMSSCAQKLYK
jgi:hypothetical protein